MKKNKPIDINKLSFEEFKKFMASREYQEAVAKGIEKGLNRKWALAMDSTPRH